MFNPEIIRRQNLQRREAIFAGVKGRSAGDVGDDVQKLIKETTLPPGYSFDVGGQMQRAGRGLRRPAGAMALAVIFIYIVLASQFGSFLQPIAIMASLPLALIGVMLALLLWRSTLNVFRMIGLVMLMGLVTKNAILLVDFANHARKAGATRGRGAAAGRADPHAADHHDHRGDGLRHAAAGAGAERRRRDPGADGPRHHRRRDHLARC